ncbi:MAG: hypothetical protein LBP73_04290 [Clostridiales Family XIII bacterium]|jgi:hypothetical protein|nr:hypothetical protein [Clostridiales Family XIII bacterium]
MKSSIRKRTFAAAYRLLDRVSPTDGDCGRLCGSACCCAGEEDASAQGFDLGIYLLPGEEKLFARRGGLFEWSVSKAEDGDFPDSWRGDVHFVRCKAPPHCERRMRPLQCRFFPLAPHLLADGSLKLILFPMEHLPYDCPLISERRPLRADFIRASYTVWRRLIRDPLIRDLVAYDSKERDADALVFVCAPPASPCIT